MDYNSMDINPQPNDPRDIKKLLEENQQLLRLILNNTEKTRRYVFFGRLMSTIYLLLIVGSLIFAAFTLPPLVEKAVGPYRDLLGSPSGSNNQDLINEVQSFLEDYSR